MKKIVQETCYPVSSELSSVVREKNRQEIKDGKWDLEEQEIKWPLSDIEWKI